jgi:hypothetical protein
VATKDHKKRARGLIEGLESRIHRGPPIHVTELSSARDFLDQHDFSPASDYFSRLAQIQHRVGSRAKEPCSTPGKRNYGGEAAGCWMQVQSAYDHVILSTCFGGQFNLQAGRIKISHRFNQEGRIDFVELKFLRSLHACLTGEIRKLLLVKDYQTIPKNWLTTTAFVLEVLPRELMFLHEGLFRFPHNEVVAWLVNIGHRLVEDLLQELPANGVNGGVAQNGRNPGQLCLSALLDDEVALPLLRQAASLESAVRVLDSKTVELRYLRRLRQPPHGSP